MYVSSRQQQLQPPSPTYYISTLGSMNRGAFKASPWAEIMLTGPPVGGLKRKHEKVVQWICYKTGSER